MYFPTINVMYVRLPSLLICKNVYKMGCFTTGTALPHLSVNLEYQEIPE